MEGMSVLKYLIAIPAMEMCPVPFAYSLATLRKVGATRISVISGAAVHEARNELAKEAIESGADRVLWLDSDMAFGEDLMERLAADLDDGWDMVCGIYFKRRLPVEPVIYKGIDAQSGKVDVYADYPRDSVFEIAGCGFGAVMTTTRLLAMVAEEASVVGPFSPYHGLSEDLSFCWRASEVKARIICDSRVKVGHVGQMAFGEQMYRRVES